MTTLLREKQSDDLLEFTVIIMREKCHINMWKKAKRVMNQQQHKLLQPAQVSLKKATTTLALSSFNDLTDQV